MSKDFTPVTLAAIFPTAIMIHPSVPAKNVQEFVALVKSQPGKLAYSSAGTGNGSHLTVELFRAAAGGLDMVHVPYKGGAPIRRGQRSRNSSRDGYLHRLSCLYLAGSKRLDRTNIEQHNNMNVTAIRNARGILTKLQYARCTRLPTLPKRRLCPIGERLASGPQSPAIDALLGLGASFVDPGATVSPELLRRHARQLPVAPVWQGVFAGAMTPLRVMTDQGGLGRLIAKSLLAPDDLQGRPTCDIAYEELIRWITPGRSLKLDLRGMSARTLTVELVAGVTCVFAYGRLDTVAMSNTTSKAEAARTPSAESRSAGSGRTLQDLETVMMNVLRRVERLETQIISRQRSLNLPDPTEGKSRKGSGKKSG
jgi:hypothetical protein